MLVLTRHPNEKIILIDGDSRIEIMIVEIRSDSRVRLGITAPNSVNIYREEVEAAIKHGGKPRDYRRNTS